MKVMASILVAIVLSMAGFVAADTAKPAMSEKELKEIIKQIDNSRKSGNRAAYQPKVMRTDLECGFSNVCTGGGRTWNCGGGGYCQLLAN